MIPARAASPARTLRLRSSAVGAAHPPARQARPTAFSMMTSAVPAAKQQRIEFPNGRAQKLVGILTSPGEASHAVVFCHGYGSSKAGFHLPALADALAAVGVASLRFDFAGAASCMCAKEVTGDGPAAKCGSPKSNCEDWFNCCTSGNGESDGTFRLAGYWDEVEDIRCAVMLLREQERLNVCAILGHSKGGTDVILYASKYDGEPECECIINVCGRFFLATGIEERFGADIFERLKDEGPISMPHPSKNGPDWILTEEDLQERVDTDVPAAAKKIRHSHILTLHGTADSTMPISNGYAVTEAVRNSSIRVFEGADHGFSKHGPEVVAAVVEHVQRHLQALE